jgi:hypothetical protein
MVKLKNKINLVQGIFFLRMRLKIDIKNKNNVIIKWWNWKEFITFTKRPRKKLAIKNNDDQIKKHNTINLNWMIKLKTNKTFIKGSR